MSLEIPENNDVVVIGSGVGGLACALELARQGLKVCVLEQHRAPGGYAQGFRRKGYSFDVSMHHIGGLAPGGLTHAVLDGLGVLSKVDVSRQDVLLTAAFPGLEVTLPNEPGAAIEGICELFPDQASGIRRLFTYLEVLKADVVVPVLDPDYAVPPTERPSAAVLKSTFRDIVEEFVSGEALLGLLGQLWMYIGLPPSLSTATFTTCVVGSSFIEGAFHIKGGGAALTRAMVERLRELGGECVTGARVSRIIVEGGAAKGVEIDGDEVRLPACVFVSGANPYQTFFDLIPGDEVSTLFRHRLKQMKSSLSLISLYLGLDCPPTTIGVPKGNSFYNSSSDTDDAYRRCLDGTLDRTDFCVTSYESSDPGACPDGGGLMTLAEPTPAGDWLVLDDAEYEKRKEVARQQVLGKLEERFPGLGGHIVTSEFATPRTMWRYTGNHEGAVYGLAQTVEQSNSRRLRNRTPIRGLYLTGAWTWSGGGYEGALMTGIQTANAVLDELDAPRKGGKLASLTHGKPGVDEPEPAHDHYRHVVPVRVFGDDLGFGGVTSASACLRYLDRGRVEAIEEICGAANIDSWLDRYVVNVYRLVAKFDVSTSLGDRLEVRTGLRKRSSHRAAFDQRIVVPETSEVVVDALVEVLFLDLEGKLASVPEELAERLDRGSPPQFETVLPSPFTGDELFPFRRRYRVYYEDTDAQAIAYHVSYVRFCERALAELLCADDSTRWRGSERLRISRLQIRYLNSASLGDRIEIRTGGRLTTESCLSLEQRIVSAATSQVLANAIVEVHLTDQMGAPMPIPEQVARACSH